MVRRLIGTVAIGIMLLAATACSSIESGRVTGKNYEPAYSYITMQCMSYNKDGICTMNMPMTHWVAEAWYLDLDNGEDTGTVSVNEAEYNKYSVGQQYP
jgi:hypothetical protein